MAEHTAKSKRPIFRYSILGCLLIATLVYELHATEFRHGTWFGHLQSWQPFFGFPPNKASGRPGGFVLFPTPEANRAGLHEGYIVSSINGRALTSTAIAGEEFERTPPGGLLTVTASHRDGSGKDVEETLRIRRPELPFQFGLLDTVTVVILPYLPIFLGFWVAFARPRDPLAWLVLALMLSYASFFHPGAEHWSKGLRDFGVAFREANFNLLVIWLLLFGIYFPERFPTGSGWARLESWKWIVIVPLAVLTARNVAIAISNLENWNGLRFLRNAMSVTGVGETVLQYTAGLGFGLLAVKYRQSISPDAKRRLRLLCAGGVVSFGPFFISSLIQSVGRFSFETRYNTLAWITYLIFFLFPLVLAYVILVHRAMDVRVVLRQGLQYALAKNGVRVIQLLLTIAIFSSAVVLVAGNSSNRMRELVVIGAGLALVWAIGQGSEHLRHWVDRRFFRESYNADLLLSELSDQVRSMVEPKSLLQTVVDRISGTLHIQKAAAILVGENHFSLAYFHGNSPLPELKISYEWTIKQLSNRKEPIRVNWDHHRSSMNEEECRELEQLEPEVLLPLSGREKLLGFVSLGGKRSEEPFTSSDLRLLNSVAVQAGLALENAQLMAAITEEVAQRERLHREVEIAREVQERLFPQHLPAIEGLDYCGACRPAMGVGGDYYDFLALPGSKLGIAIGDVSGKGISAALLMASLEASLRAEATRGAEHLPDLVGNVNRLVYQASTSNRYATFFYGQYSFATKEFAYVNAGHNSPMLFRRSGEGVEVKRLAVGGTVVGLLEHVSYQQEIVALARGDILVAFTDGISEAMNSLEEEWGEERLTDTVKSCTDLASKEILARIMREADAFASGAPQHDDMTLIVLKCDG